MNYGVSLSPQAREAWNQYIDYLAIAKQSPLVAERWFKKSSEALKTLKQFPNRCPFAIENGEYEHPIRALIVDQCLFLYRVDEESKLVRILDFRHGSQLPRKLDLQDQ